MINEISQNLLGAVAAQSKRESGATSQVKSPQTVNVLTESVYKKVDATNAKEPSGPAEPDGSALEGKQLEEMVDDLNGLAQAVQRQLQFSVDGEDGKVYVKVVDAETKDVIREIPSEEIRNMQRHLRDVSNMMFQKGESSSLLFKGEA
ncbi:MAG: flagellar protein FlaG [Gammaproteobacteria bacterium]|nr:flagellar protein FlaG [Gammaproteobacteria bacterium]